MRKHINKSTEVVTNSQKNNSNFKAVKKITLEKSNNAKINPTIILKATEHQNIVMKLLLKIVVI